jgi:DNA-binding transcriptional LysR family regulator
MDPTQLPALVAFARVAHHGSFTRAAAELGVSPSALSQNLRTLEARMGVRLLNRTTRRVALTEHGARFLQRVLPGLELIGAAFDDMDEAREQVSGTLRVTLPRIAVAMLLAPALGEFARAYPQLTLDLSVDDALTDLVAGGFDCGIRLGERLARDVIAVRISEEQRLAVVSSPDYFRRYPPPRTPQDLQVHNCARMRFVSSGTIYRWEFTAPQGGELEIDVNGGLISNDVDLILAWARQGLGLACLFEQQVRDDLKSGGLVRVLEDWCPPFPGFYLYYPSRAHLPLKLRVFIDFLQARLQPTTLRRKREG